MSSPGPIMSSSPAPLPGGPPIRADDDDCIVELEDEEEEKEDLADDCMSPPILDMSPIFDRLPMLPPMPGPPMVMSPIIFFIMPSMSMVSELMPPPPPPMADIWPNSAKIRDFPIRINSVHLASYSC
jgi:hypothetical protein